MGAPFDVVLTLVVSFLLRNFVYDCQKDFFSSVIVSLSGCIR